MRLYHELPQAHLTAPSHVTVGVFDGVHRGHRLLIGRLIEAAHAAGRLAVVVTFAPHPARVLGYDSPPMLTTIPERAALLADLGLDALVVCRFTERTARTPAVEFVALLLRHLRMVELWGGYDFAFGHRREGDVPFLRRLGAEEGFAVRIVEPLIWHGAPVSSSRVRAALRAGDVDEATGCLGRPYRLSGRVVRGRGIGRELGLPTANLAPPPERLIPADGVYAGLARWETATVPAVINIGRRPTFAGRERVVEAHLLDFSGDLYGRTLALDFLARLRDERAFPDVDALQAQIRADIAQARALIAAPRSTTGGGSGREPG